MASIPFLTPRLKGARFESGEIPLEILRDFSVLAEMIVEVAKWEYLKEKPDRKRTPRGFMRGISLKIAGIERGSAIAHIVISMAGMLACNPQLEYFEKAKNSIINTIGAVENGENISGHLSRKLLRYFDRFGINLNDDEAIEFYDQNSHKKATLTKESRRRLVRASATDMVTEEAVICGTIVAMDKIVGTFDIQLIDGSRVKGPLSDQHYDTITEIFVKFKKDQEKELVRMSVNGSFGPGDRLKGIESVEHISILDPLDTRASLEELSLLKDGWLNGEGIALNRIGLNWLADKFDDLYPDDIPLPYLFPTYEGRVLAEWNLRPWMPSLEINLETHNGHWYLLNFDTDEEETGEFDLTDTGSWDWLANKIRSLVGVQS